MGILAVAIPHLIPNPQTPDFLGNSSLHCLPSTGVQSQWLWTKLRIASPRGCLCLQWAPPFLSGQKPHLSSQVCGHLLLALVLSCGGFSHNWAVPPQPWLLCIAVGAIGSGKRWARFTYSWNSSRSWLSIPINGRFFFLFHSGLNHLVLKGNKIVHFHGG